MQRLQRDFYDRDTEDVARDLLGKLLVHQTPTGLRVGRITEAEAYVGAHDLAAHSRRGVTPRTEVMFGPPGHAYVYLIYGIYHCLNVVTEAQGQGCAVLLRALQPLSGVELDTRGPGLLCRAMGVDLSLNRADLCSSALYIADDGHAPGKILCTPRIGVHYAGEWAQAPLRFLLADNPWVSGKTRGKTARPDRQARAPEDQS